MSRSEVEQQAFREWQREDASEKGGGYKQESMGGLLVEYREREGRLKSHPGKNGLASCAVLMDIDYALERDAKGQLLRVPEWAAKRASEWIDGTSFDGSEPKRVGREQIDGVEFDLYTDTSAFEPQLVESIPDLQEAIRLAHEAEGHLVRWEGRWTSLEALFRILDDTRAVRRIAGAASRKPRRTVLTGIGAARGFCMVCGARRDHGRVWRDLNRDTFWCSEHGEQP